MNKIITLLYIISFKLSKYYNAAIHEVIKINFDIQYNNV